MAASWWEGKEKEGIDRNKTGVDIVGPSLTFALKRAGPLSQKKKDQLDGAKRDKKQRKRGGKITQTGSWGTPI